MDREKFQKAYGKLVAKAWADDDFKAKLLADPVAVFKAQEIKILDGVDVKVVENTDTLTHLILPAQPSGEISDDELGVIAGGFMREDM